MSRKKQGGAGRESALADDVNGDEAPYRDAIVRTLEDHARALQTGIEGIRAQAGVLGALAEHVVHAIRGGGKVLLAGNGGSAAEAQHCAAELVGRFVRERPAYPALALTADSSIITAVSNDYGYEQVFSRQIAAYGTPGDVFIAFSTSGESKNLLRACEAARSKGILAAAVTGQLPNKLEAAADLTIHVPVREAAVVQEIHTLITHLLCEIVEAELGA